MSAVNPVDIGSFTKEPKLFILLAVKSMQNLPDAVKKQIEFVNSVCRAETTQAIPHFLKGRFGIEFRLDSTAAYQNHLLLLMPGPNPLFFPDKFSRINFYSTL